MIDALRQGMSLISATWQLLSGSRRLMLPFLFSTVIIFVLLLSLGWVVWHTESNFILNPDQPIFQPFCWLMTLILSFFYVAHFLLFTANAIGALSVEQILDQQHFSLWQCSKTVFKHTVTLLHWTLISSTYGSMIKITEPWFDDWAEKAYVKRQFNGLHWSIASLLAIPEIFINRTPPGQAVQSASHLLVNRYGVVTRFQFPINLVTLPIRIAVFIPLIVAASVSATNIYLHACAALAIGGWVLVSAVNTCLLSILTSVLHRALRQQSTGPFSPQQLEHAFK